MRSLTKLQWGLISAAILLVVLLYNLDIKAPKTTKAGSKEETNNKNKSNNIDFEQLKSMALKSVPAEAKNSIVQLDKNLSEASEDKKLNAREELADAYYAYKQYVLAAMLFEENSALLKNASAYVKAGDAYRDAYRNNNDSNITPILVTKAKEQYQLALDLEPKNLDAKTGLGTCYVDASENPMQGIQLLLEVVKEDPENKNANQNLGLFSMRSGQFDKAIKRFEVVAKKSPSAESYAMLAEAYEQSGDKKSAISALKKAKEYVIDPQISQGIDDYIKNLEN